MKNSKTPKLRKPPDIRTQLVHHNELSATFDTVAATVEEYEDSDHDSDADGKAHGDDDNDDLEGKIGVHAGDCD